MFCYFYDEENDDDDLPNVLTLKKNKNKQKSNCVSGLGSGAVFGY